MNYEILYQFMQANYFYVNVTDEQFANLRVNHFMTMIGGIRYIGSNTRIPELVEQELVKPEGFGEEVMEEVHELPEEPEVPEEEIPQEPTEE